MKNTFIDTTIFPEMDAARRQNWKKIIWGAILVISAVCVILFVLAVSGEGLVPVSR